jgi:hypothetical protein
MTVNNTIIQHQNSELDITTPMKTHRNILQRLLIGIAALAVTALLPAQELTNDKVLRMIKAELPESAILAAIQNDPAGLDTSADELIRMKEGGASKAVLDAMLAAKAKPVAPPATAPPVMQTVPNFNQVVAVVGDRRIDLQHGGEMKASGGPFGGKVRQTFKGEKSPTRLRWVYSCEHVRRQENGRAAENREDW